MSTTLSQRSVPVPEPDLTPDAMIERAIALQPRLRAEQDETERRSVHSEAIHEEFRKAGFYRCLQPRRFGGYEFDLKTYYRLGIEIARGDPSVAWCLIVGAGHALMLGSFFDEQAQADGFGPDGNFSAPSVAAPTGTATPVDGGWLVKGKWGYASGAPYATHFMPSVLILEDPDKPRAGIALVPRSQWKMLDDWGAILGMKGSGSNSIVIEGARVPKSHVIHLDMLDIDIAGGTPGSRLHGNAMYAGRCLSFFHAELVAVLVGLGYAAIDEYEKIIRTKTTLYPPMMLRYLHHDYQRYLGLALGMMNAAKRLVLNAGDVYMEYCRRGFEGGEPFTMEEDLELFASLEHGGRLVWEAVEMLFRTSSSSGAKDGERMQRYYRDASIYRGHLSAQYDMAAQRLALAHLGLNHAISTADRGAPPPAGDPKK
jgi:3-hydroxy-9,10-secoandrosta-1,3,5(10)-triene-9,17-dione monooxygenase